MCVFMFLLGLGLTAVAGAPSAKPHPFKIVGGNETSIEKYPFQASILWTKDFDHIFATCGAIIINNMSVLTAARCVRVSIYDPNVLLGVRVGSNFQYSGGVVHNVEKYVTLNQTPGLFDLSTNLAVVRLASPIAFNGQAQPATLAGPDYKLGDHEMVWASGWGPLWSGSPPVKQLRHVQTRTVNQAECTRRYAYYDVNVTEVMLCASLLDVGHHGICWDTGGPLVHNGVVVGMSAWNLVCGSKYLPDIFARISTASKWIEANA